MAETELELQTDAVETEVENERRGMSLWAKLLAWGLVLGLLAVVAVQLVATQQGNVGPGEPAPNFTLTTFAGEEIGAAEMQGKIIVLNFWASWCKPCEQEAADLQTAWEMYEPSGEVLFLGADYVDTQIEASKYLEKFSITYPNGPDLGTRISQAFRIRGVPETYFIDKEGNLAYVKIGPFTTLAEITDIIDGLLDS
ncbi:MAG: TlpA family protein disulfide reductase [Chloroflexi bacterium]|nr:MAG: TlpA family protein disulfide reductase [Chloroflexota bacterium]MBL1194184.1 TlpA family protein disulfide reductase [Chloroflexota bacterium]NOH11476.1 TlpA family protein disulfide reductase [Chloroflexota bacterium]